MCKKGGISVINEDVEKFLNEVKELLNEIKNEQTKLAENVEKYHKVNMRNFEKIRTKFVIWQIKFSKQDFQI